MILKPKLATVDKEAQEVNSIIPQKGRGIHHLYDMQSCNITSFSTIERRRRKRLLQSYPTVNTKTSPIRSAAA